MMSQSPFLAFRLGKSELGRSFTIGSVCELSSHITTKHHFMLFYHGRECANADESKNLTSTVP